MSEAICVCCRREVYTSHASSRFVCDQCIAMINRIHELHITCGDLTDRVDSLTAQLTAAKEQLSKTKEKT